MLAMAMSTLSLVTTIFVLHFHHTNWTCPVPRWIQRLAFDGLARVMCMKLTVGGDLQRRETEPDRRDLKVKLLNRKFVSHKNTEATDASESW